MNELFVVASVNGFPQIIKPGNSIPHLLCLREDQTIPSSCVVKHNAHVGIKRQRIFKNYKNYFQIEHVWIYSS